MVCHDSSERFVYNDVAHLSYEGPFPFLPSLADDVIKYLNELLGFTSSSENVQQCGVVTLLKGSPSVLASCNLLVSLPTVVMTFSHPPPSSGSATGV